MPETVTPARVLTIREPHLSDILAGRKTVEFRGYIGPAKPTLIALHTSVKDDPLRIGQIVAVAVIVRCPHGDVLLCDRCLVTHARHTAQGVDLSRWPHEEMLTRTVSEM